MIPDDVFGEEDMEMARVIKGDSWVSVNWPLVICVFPLMVIKYLSVSGW